DVVQALHQPPAGVVVDLEGGDHVAAGDRLVLQVHGDLGAGFGFEHLPDQLDVLLGQLGGQQSLLTGVAAEDVGEPGGEHDLETVVLQRPDGVLAGGTGPEVRAGHEHGAGGVGLLVQHDGRVTAPGGEQRVREAGAGDPLEVHGRDDLVGVDVAAAQRYPDTGVGGELLHDVLLSGGRGSDVHRDAGIQRRQR